MKTKKKSNKSSGNDDDDDDDDKRTLSECSGATLTDPISKKEREKKARRTFIPFLACFSLAFERGSNIKEIRDNKVRMCHSLFLFSPSLSFVSLFLIHPTPIPSPITFAITSFHCQLFAITVFRSHIFTIV